MMIRLKKRMTPTMSDTNHSQPSPPSTGGVSRREFLATAGAAAALVLTTGGLAFGGGAAWASGRRGQGQEAGRAGANDAKPAAPLFRISLAQWSLHRMHFGGQLNSMDFPKFTKDTFGIEAVEYVNSFYRDSLSNPNWAAELRQRVDDLGMKSLLIMCDREGALGDPDEGRRKQAVENHRKWLEAARTLGCHSIRVNAQSEGAPEVQAALAADGLRRLCEVADPMGLNVIVENHGGLSSAGVWLADVMKRVDHPRVGTLPDFGNFSLGNGLWYNRYEGVQELMPYAKAVSAKTNDFDEAGNDTRTDYLRMMRIVLKAGYRGYVGIEYEGSNLPEVEGVKATKSLLERVRAEILEKGVVPG